MSDLRPNDQDDESVDDATVDAFEAALADADDAYAADQVADAEWRRDAEAVVTDERARFEQDRAAAQNTIDQD